LLQSTGYYGFIFDGVERASRVGDLASYFQKLEALEKNTGLEDMQGGTVLGRPFFPFLRNFTDRSVGTAGDIAYYTVEEDSCICMGLSMLGLIA